MLTSTNKSRPVYPGLAPRPFAQRHLIAAEGEGAAAVAELVAAGAADFAAKASILYTAGASAPSDPAGRLGALGADSLATFPSIETLLFRLDAMLATAGMGTALYVTGTEGFIGRVIALAAGHGIDHLTIAAEHRGSLARRVQCVHCKGFTENVTTSVVACSHCALPLTVRDHYSRRLGAFQGVCVNAEDPSEAPVAEEVFR
ncbi:dimethylamine monooxygenase subunit DmmA family protein [Methylobrevis albus]|uniref:Uncharacterized protein n=1 Tax=Methylobrevis albus TaxID=2793297 RepID=A0A931MXW1_9HYPH|nr:dimethylamine monooxygenase subunit DmmA family protein [Methylobrevis albus]MBH0236424.1 hypothetical protein [Methylobrevis albus]